MRHSFFISCLIFISLFFHLRAEEDGHKNSSKTLPSPHKFTGLVAFVTDYRSRGVSETLRRPAVQGQFLYTHTSGFYAKAWASNTDGTGHLYNNTSLEVDLFLGIKQQVEHTPLVCELGLIYYYYPGGESFNRYQVSYDTLEYYVGLKYKNLEFKLYQDLTDFFGTNSHNPPFNWHTMRFVRPNGHSRGSIYLEATGEWSPYPKWKTSVQLGYQMVVNYPETNLFFWQLGITRTFKWFDASIFYIDTTGNPAYYDVLDNAFDPSTRRIAGPGVYLSIVRSF